GVNFNQAVGCGLCLILGWCVTGAVERADADGNRPRDAKTRVVVEQHFDADPNWDGFRNRLLPPQLPKVKQSFGYRRSNFAGGDRAGEIGGTIQRSTRRAYYGKAIDSLSLDSRLTASGLFAVTRADSSSGLL